MFSIKTNMVTDEGDNRSEIWHKRWNRSSFTELDLGASWTRSLRASWLKGLNGIQWSQVQIPPIQTFYSYFKNSFSGEYQIYIYMVFI